MLRTPPYISLGSSSSTPMNLWQKWNSLPVKARYYIGASTFVFALVGDYVTSRVNDEVVSRKKILTELEKESDK